MGFPKSVFWICLFYIESIWQIVLYRIYIGYIFFKNKLELEFTVLDTQIYSSKK